tara:strand:- start:12995 stop:13168 length:174 start_codon:yes stop_codon:yes gene_type:complete
METEADPRSDRDLFQAGSAVVCVEVKLQRRLHFLRDERPSMAASQTLPWLMLLVLSR